MKLPTATEIFLRSAPSRQYAMEQMGITDEMLKPLADKMMELVVRDGMVAIKDGKVIDRKTLEK